MKNRTMMIIKNNLKTLYKDTRGGAMSILLLFLLPMLLFMFISKTEETRILRATNVTLEYAVEEAARQGAMMIDPESQAKGNPLIAYNKAIPMMEEQLKVTLGLDDYFKSNSETSLNNIKYDAIIYNGATSLEGYKYDDYYNENYENNNVAYLVEASSTNGMRVIDTPSTETEFKPMTYYVSDEHGITDYHTEDSIKITMDSPGILLVVQASINPVIVNQETDDYKEIVTRYAYAKIVKRE